MAAKKRIFWRSISLGGRPLKAAKSPPNAIGRRFSTSIELGKSIGRFPFVVGHPLKNGDWFVQAADRPGVSIEETVWGMFSGDAEAFGSWAYMERLGEGVSKGSYVLVAFVDGAAVLSGLPETEEDFYTMISAVEPLGIKKLILHSGENIPDMWGGEFEHTTRSLAALNPSDIARFKPLLGNRGGVFMVGVAALLGAAAFLGYSWYFAPKFAKNSPVVAAVVSMPDRTSIEAQRNTRMLEMLSGPCPSDVLKEGMALVRNRTILPGWEVKTALITPSSASFLVTSKEPWLDGTLSAALAKLAAADGFSISTEKGIGVRLEKPLLFPKEVPAALPDRSGLKDVAPQIAFASGMGVWTGDVTIPVVNPLPDSASGLRAAANELPVKPGMVNGSAKYSVLTSEPFRSLLAYPGGVVQNISVTWDKGEDPTVKLNLLLY